MIFFVADQIAGAEYILPLLDKQRRAATPAIPHKLFASPIAGRFFSRHGYDCTVPTTCCSEEIESFFLEYTPSACFMSATGESLIERSFLLNCRRRGLYTVQCIDNWLNYRARFVRAGITLFPDRILTIDGRAAEAMIAEGIPAKLISIVGQPYVEYRKAQESTHRGKDGLLLITQPVSKYYDRVLGYDEGDFVIGAVEAAFRAGIRNDRIHINVHPAEQPSRYKDVLSRAFGAAGDTICVVHGDLVLPAYQMVIGMFSSVLVQAVLNLVPTASFQPDATAEDQCFLSAAGLIPRITSADHLETFLKAPRLTKDVHELVSVIEGSCGRFEQIVLEASCRTQST